MPELIARVILTAVFAVAAVGKLADLQGSGSAMESFGMPQRLAPAAGVLLPIVELVLAGLLILDSTAQVAAWGAFALLAIFVAAIARLMARGEVAECHCFGAIHSAPVGRATLLRNAGLAALALLVGIGGPGDELSGWVASLHGTGALAAAEGLALIAVVVGAGMFVMSLLRRHGVLLLRIDELEARLAGSETGAPARPAPGFVADGLHGETATLQSLLAPELPLLLLFTDPACAPCNALMPEVGRWQSEYAGVLSIAVISSGAPADNLAKAREHGAGNVYLQSASTISDAYGVTGTPSAVLVGADATIAEDIAPGADEIRRLVTRAAAGWTRPLIEVHAPAGAPAGMEPEPEPALSRGAAVPRRTLTDVRGATVDLAAGQPETLLVFWDPECGFCERMEPELAAWERERGERDPRLVLVSAGTAESLSGLGFSAPIVPDPGSSMMREFGAPGTPSALRVDGRGRVTSEMAVGGPEVLALARSDAAALTRRG